jgi:hypothetical protein
MPKKKFSEINVYPQMVALDILELLSCSYSGEFVSMPTAPQLCEELGYQESTSANRVQRQIRWLRDHGYLEVRTGRDENYYYFVTVAGNALLENRNV